MNVSLSAFYDDAAAAEHAADQLRREGANDANIDVVNRPRQLGRAVLRRDPEILFASVAVSGVLGTSIGVAAGGLYALLAAIPPTGQMTDALWLLVLAGTGAGALLGQLAGAGVGVLLHRRSPAVVRQRTSYPGARLDVRASNSKALAVAERVLEDTGPASIHVPATKMPVAQTRVY